MKTTITDAQMAQQHAYMDAIAQKNATQNRVHYAYTHTYGCQQNTADTERIAGMLCEMGYQMTTEAAQADVIVMNTCAVREHAEQKALSHLGEYAHIKRANPDVTVCLCGCMAQQEHIPEKIRRSYPQVDILFGTHMLWRFPELLYRKRTQGKRVFDISGEEGGIIAEGVPVQREAGAKAWLSIMYGCNNFCTYCIVPYVRGRERSRNPQDIENELRELVAQGYKDITLLGQNVNSYGKDLDETIDFSDLLRRLNDIEGDFLIRFMTSHPKDASYKLFDTMADCAHVAKQLHLPVQSGSDDVLHRMNRGYTAAHYRDLIAYARAKMPHLTVSSDIIVGFPNESAADFDQTMQLIAEIGYDQLFTFQYSKRSGTPAASYADVTPLAEKQERFTKLLRLQEKISNPKQALYQDCTLRVLVEAITDHPTYPYSARTEGGLLVCFRAEEGQAVQIGQFVHVKIEKTSMRSLSGMCVEIDQ